MSLLKAKALYDVYSRGCRFPGWCLEPSTFTALDWDKTLVFFPKGADIETVVRLAREREPVNMGMLRPYDKKKMKKYFGFSTGFYGKYFTKHGSLAPNIAIYVCTRVRLDETLTVPRVHLLSLAGVAFDRQEQPDFQALCTRNKDGYSVDKKQIRQLYMRIWLYAGFCAQYLNLKKVRVFKVGGGEFAPPNLHFGLEVFHPCLKRLRKLFPKIEFQYSLDYRIPESLKRCTKSEFEETLFINAWDPWSMIGNGNAGDTSLDGFWGRISAAAVLGSPLVNDQIRYVSCDIEKRLNN